MRKNPYMENGCVYPTGLYVVCNFKFQSGRKKLKIEGHLPRNLCRCWRGLGLI